MAGFCGRCGSRLDEATGLCPNCNKEQLQAASRAKHVQPDTAPSARQGAASQEQTGRQHAPRRSGTGLAAALQDSKTRRMGLAAAGVAAVIVVAGIVTRCGSGSSGGGLLHSGPQAFSDQRIQSAPGACISYNGDEDVYIPMADGECITVEGVSRAGITPDRQRIVVADHDGGMYVTNREQTIREEVDGYVSRFIVLRNDGYIYYDGYQYYRVSFANMTPVLLTDLDSDTISMADHSISMIYADSAGSIYMLAADEQEPRLLSDVGSDRSQTCIMDDGSLVFWTVPTGDGGHRGDDLGVVIYEDGEQTILHEGEYASSDITATADQGLVVIRSSTELETANCTTAIWLKYPGKEPKQLDCALTGEWQKEIYTDYGLLSDTNADDADHLYMSVEGEDDKYNVYSVSLGGKAEEILTGISSYRIANGVMAYTQSDELHIAQVRDGHLSKDTRIVGYHKYVNGDYETQEVGDYQLTQNGQYLYYTVEGRGEDIGEGTYCYRMRDGRTETISTDYISVSGLWYSVDGDAIVGEDDDQWMWLWQYGDKEMTLIDQGSDYVSSVLFGSRQVPLFDPDTFLYMTNAGDGRYDIVRYQDGESTLVAAYVWEF